MKRLLTYLIPCIMTIAIAISFDCNAQKRKTVNQSPRTSATIKKERKSAREAIKNTGRQIEENKRITQRTLNDLDLINAEIDQLNSDISSLQVRIDSINSATAHLADTITLMDRRLDAMRQTYAKSVRATRSAGRNQMTRLAFIFSSRSFTQAYRRMRYMREYTAWQSHQVGEIHAKKDALNRRRAELDSMLTVRSNAINSMKNSRSDLDKRQKRADTLVKELKKKDASLRKVLSDNEKKAKALDSELDRVIALEQKKAAEEAKRKAAEEEARKKAETAKTKPDSKESTKPQPPVPAKTPSAPAKTSQQGPTDPLGGTFAENRGKLPFPVSGDARIVRGFGKQQHPQLPKVTINNSGIDIEASKGAGAHAIFDGKVSAIFKQQGFNNIVMIRHGEYLTIYANLAKINVKNGDTVSQGQTIGTIYSDTADSNRTVLHFEIRHEKEKLDPTLWLKPHR